MHVTCGVATFVSISCLHCSHGKTYVDDVGGGEPQTEWYDDACLFMPDDMMILLVHVRSHILHCTASSATTQERHSPLPCAMLPLTQRPVPNLHIAIQQCICGLALRLHGPRRPWSSAETHQILANIKEHPPQPIEAAEHEQEQRCELAWLICVPPTRTFDDSQPLIANCQFGASACSACDTVCTNHQKQCHGKLHCQRVKGLT